MNLKLIEELLRHTYQEAEYPALKEQITNWTKERPLDGIKLLDATPVYRNTLLKHLALIAAGAQLTVCKKRSRLLQQKRRCCYSSDVAKLMFSS